jgi:hypothetical protein
MLHPFEPDFTNMKDSEIEEKIFELNKKYYQASRLGNPELLTQLSTFVNIYKQEMSRRYAERTKNSRGQMDGDLDQLINVE